MKFLLYPLEPFPPLKGYRISYRKFPMNARELTRRLLNLLYVPQAAQRKSLKNAEKSRLRVNHYRGTLKRDK